MNEILSDIDVAGAMLLIQQRGGDKPTLAETGTGALERKQDGAFLATQPSAPGQAKKEKTAVALTDNDKGGATAPPVFVYDNYDWQTYEVFNLHNANATLQLVNSSTKVRSDASKSKRKIVVQAGEYAARKIKKKFKKTNREVKRVKTEVGASAAAAPQHGAAASSALQHEQLKLEIEILNRRLAEKTAKLEQAKRLRNKASDLQNSQNLQKQKRAAHKAQRANGANFISLTPITNGGKYKFAESRDFKVHEPGDNKTVPPMRVKMADWETQVNLGQWGRLRGFTDCRRCFGHCGAVHLKTPGCLAAQEVRRYKLKKHYMDIERKKVAAFKQANRKQTKKERRKLARTMNMAKKNSISQMSAKQRALLKEKAILPSCV